MVTPCPILDCNKHVADKQIVCFGHWEMVPLRLREVLKKAKKDRTSPEWQKACAEAISEVQKVALSLRADDATAALYSATR